MSEIISAIAQTEKSTKALTSVAASIVKILAEFPAAVETHTAVIYSIEEAQNKLDLIVQETASAGRKAAAELSISILENEDNVLATLMSQRGYSTITDITLSNLRDELEDATSDNKADTAKAVAMAERSINSTNELATANLTAEHSVAVAQKDADLKAKDMQISFMATQISTLEQTIRDERQARVDMAASAAGAQGVVVNTSSK